jgi:nitrite reductase/ring-hydroxylating ferredoxin subunit
LYNYLTRKIKGIRVNAEFYPVLEAGEIAAGKTRVVQAGGKAVLLCNIGGRIHAVENLCSHLAAPLDRARIRDGMIICPVHGAKFDPESGAARCPPASAPLTVFTTRINNGWIEVQI